MTYIPRFKKKWFRHSNISRKDSLINRQHGDLIILLAFFPNKESRLKIMVSLPIMYGAINRPLVPVGREC
jgi:hypothetical protein